MKILPPHCDINHGVFSDLGEQVLPKESSAKTKISSSKLRTITVSWTQSRRINQIEVLWYGCDEMIDDNEKLDKSSALLRN